MRFFGLFFRYFLLLLLCGLTVSFVLSNDKVVALQLFPLPYEVLLPLYGLALLTIVLGMICGLSIGGLYNTAKLLRLRRELRDKTQRVQAMHEQITALELERTARSCYSSDPLPQPPAFLPADAVTLR